MITFAISHGLHGLVRLLTTVVAAGWVSSPMSWSPDSRWLSYTTTPVAGPVDREPGWLFDGSRGEPSGRDRVGRVPARRGAKAARGCIGSGRVGGMARRRF